MFERISLETCAYIGYVKVKVWSRNGKIHYSKDLMSEEGKVKATISSFSVEEFTRRIEDLHIEDWDKVYEQDSEIKYYDAGYFWTLKYKDSEKGSFTKTGDVEPLKNWKELINLLEEVVGNLWYLTEEE